MIKENRSSVNLSTADEQKDGSCTVWSDEMKVVLHHLVDQGDAEGLIDTLGNSQNALETNT